MAYTMTEQAAGMGARHRKARAERSESVTAHCDALGRNELCWACQCARLRQIDPDGWAGRQAAERRRIYGGAR